MGPEAVSPLLLASQGAIYSHSSLQHTPPMPFPAALVNKGCCVFARGDYEKGREYFQEALNVEATCTEALYNLGLAYKRLDRLPEALECFLKLHSILKNSAHVIYHLADIYDKMEDFDQATEL